jgi:alkyldihydroxyacetonephosphate synthase
MRRWNGWGDESITYPLPGPAADYLAGLVGEGARLEDAGWNEAIAAVESSRLSAHPLISTDPEGRLRHARGQSLPDWIAMRSGRISVFPDGVAYPASDEEIRSLLGYAKETGAKLIPYGGGTSVVGHINPLPGEAPVLTMDLSRLQRLLSLDRTSLLATFEAGVNGPELEKQLNAHGFTLGHFPQSFDYSTLGGWVVTRSSGQQSHHYGRIENLFAGGHVETPVGALDLPAQPASAAGPDIKQAILGSEGRLGVLTSATVRIRPLPRAEKFTGYFFHDWESGVAAVRQIAQAGLDVSLLRLSNPRETTTTLALAGKERLVGIAGHGLSILGYGEERCLLVMGITSESGSNTLETIKGEAEHLIRANGGLPTGTLIGRMWKKSRFTTPYLRNTLWERGYALDTLETAIPWTETLPTADEVLRVIRTGLEDIGERVLAFAHLSHIYTDGVSIYVTYLYRRDPDPDETLRRWQVLKGAASRVIVAHGGTISHQHGVGLDHAAYLETEKGRLGMQALKALQKEFDPTGLLNPGKLLP